MENKKKLIYAGIFIIFVLVAYFIYLNVICETHCCGRKYCCPPARCAPHCFIDNESGEEMCTDCLFCIDPNEALPVE